MEGRGQSMDRVDEMETAPAAGVRGRCIRLPRAWTAEDARLERLAKENGFRVARRMPGRSPRLCRDRWRHRLARHVYHRPFTARDDDDLRRLVARFGTTGRAVYGRTSRVMKRRWKEIRHHHLGVAKNDHQEEDDDLLELQDDQYSGETAPAPTSYADDVLASSFVSCSLTAACDGVMDPSLALGFACMAV